MIGIFFFYGLAFFVLGMAIFLTSKKDSVFVLAREFNLLAGFAILHGVNEWLDMFILIYEEIAIPSVQIFELLLLPASFIFIFQFGIRIVTSKSQYVWLRFLSAALFIIWIIIVAISQSPFLTGNIWARYLFGAPGIFLTAYALYLQIPEFKRLKLHSITSNLKLLSFSFFFYGFFSGLITPRGDFFPASVLNYSVFLDIVHIPVHIFRTFCAMLACFSLVQVMRVFEGETTSKIRAQREYANNIIQSMKDSLIVLTPSGHIRTVNRSVLELLGYEEQELLGKLVVKIEEEEEEEEYKLFQQSGLDQLIQEGFIHECDMIYIAKDGRKIPMLFSGSMMRNAMGQLEGIICIAQDVRERKEFHELKRLNKKLTTTQAQLIQSAKLASIGELATGIAHEINQPLTYISTHIQILLDELDNNIPIDSNSVQNNLNAFMQRIQRITVIIQHIRVLGRKQDDNFIKVSLYEVIDNALLLLTQRLRLSNIQLIQELEENIPTVTGNSYQLEQVFINLIQNALDILKGHKGAFIKIKMCYRAQQETVDISIYDNGPGISDDHLKYVFDPFFTTKPIGEGTGLGLSISYGIIQNHQGRIICLPQTDSGAHFKICLPV